MVNKDIFSTRTDKKTETTNAAGGPAYNFNAKHALAQIASTNCFNGTYYTNARANLEIAKNAVEALKEDPVFIAKTAIYARKKAFMKDMPAFLTVMLVDIDTQLFRKVFPLVIDNGKMLQNFVQIALSGKAGRKINLSRGTCKHAFRDWFHNHTSEEIFRASVGKPSMRDILRLTHPKPENEEKATLYAYLKGAEIVKEHTEEGLSPEGVFRTYDKEGNVFVNNKGVRYSHGWRNLPEIVKSYEAYKANKEGPIPNVDFRFLASLNLSKEEWTEIARNAPWHMTRMNLNTFERHGVFENKEVVQLIADRLRNADQIKKSKVFPYQLLAAYMNSDAPHEIKEALQDAMELATENVPAIEGKVYICPDVSGSMSCSITGYRRGSTSKILCVEAAALFSSCILRKNPEAKIMPFDTRLHEHSLNPRDTVLTNAKNLATFGGGGTNCSLPLRELNNNNSEGDVVIYISDYESWIDQNQYGYGYDDDTGMAAEWDVFKQRNPNAKLICIDLTPRENTQNKERTDVLQVGGFSDQVFEVINNFLTTGHSIDHWIEEIEKTEL